MNNELADCFSLFSVDAGPVAAAAAEGGGEGTDTEGAGAAAAGAASEDSPAPSGAFDCAGASEVWSSLADEGVESAAADGELMVESRAAAQGRS